MSYRCFDVHVEDRIAHIVLNRAEKRNSMIPEFWDELPALVRELDEEGRARVLVLSSTGPHFSSGIDVASLTGLDADVAEGTAETSEADARRAQIHANRQRGARFYANVKRMQETFTSLEACRFPVLAAIQGGCIGGAVDLVTACDLRYATEDAFFTIYEINLALTADVGTFPRIVRCLPDGLVRELAYTGRRMPAAEALTAGFISRIEPDPEALLAHVFSIAREIAEKAPLAVYGTKRMLNYARDHSTADSLDYVSLWNASMLQFDEVAEAMRAKAENRPADFADLPRLPRRHPHLGS